MINFFINNDLVIHRQVKTSDVISQRFGDFMTPLSRVQMRIKLTNASSRVTTDLHSGGGHTNSLARMKTSLQIQKPHSEFKNRTPNS